MDRRTFLQAAGLGTAAMVGTRSIKTALADESAKEAADTAVRRIPRRSEVKPADTWDLTTLYPTDEAWDAAFAAWQKQAEGYAAFQGHLAESPAKLAECVKFDLEIQRIGEHLGAYSHLRVAEDQTNGTYQRMQGRFTQAVSRVGQASAYINPEILAIPAAKMDEFLQSSELAPYKLLLTRMLRFRPHTLSDKEERLLAMQTEMSKSPTLIFRQLNDGDLKFGTVKNDKGETVELSHSMYISLLESPNGDVRRNAFHTYYTQYVAHQNTLAATLRATIERDLYYAKARNYASALEAALFPDNVPVAVYENLIESVHRQLPALHRYYDVRRRKMNLKEIHHYDTYVPIVADARVQHTWDEAVDVILAALKPLGEEYGKVLGAGLRGRWCDRYENRGKQSGAFSSGCFGSDPFILINYQPDVLDHVFTLAHEGGHSMHSYYSGKNQPFAYYEYTLFVAEVASTFNESLLSKYLLDRAKDKRERACLLNRQIDSIRGTIFRQTMFAEFDKLAHASAEAGEPLTLDRLKELYHGLLAQYFGPNFTLDPEMDIECLRVPHFYRNFYVYKYATGMSAAMALADRVTGGGQQELNDYLNFLKGGCSKDPLDLLRDAGVDMEKPDRVDNALKRFGQLVDELDTLI
jgi:oligoendopeptidase F